MRLTCAKLEGRGFVDNRFSAPESGDDAQHVARAISLAHERPFALGPLTIDPGTRRITHADGRGEFVEPRVMQVLVALARARGAILTRDDLVERCWSGRIVGEDAITRVMSRLRRLSETIGQGIFKVETLTKVGYRLALNGTAYASRPSPGEAEAVTVRPGRRAFIAAGAAAGLAALVGGGTLLYRRFQEPPPDREAELLMALAWQAWTQSTREGSSQAIGLYRRAIETAPDYADAWGFLGCAYADRSHSWARPSERDPLRERARAAGQRALELEPRNAYGRAAIAYARPLMRNWLLMEREFRLGLDEQPEKWCLKYSLGLAYTRVGRYTDAAAAFRDVRNIAPTASQYLFEIRSLWGSGRLDEAERLMDDALAIYATHPGIWAARVNLLLFSGRPGAAIALIQDSQSRPADFREEVFEEMVALGRALDRRNPALVADVAASQVLRARESAGSVPYAIQVTSALGHVDDAFMLAHAYYFSRGFIVPDEKVADGHVADVSLDERVTGFLFLPPARPMREDARFGRLVHDLGLERYWEQANAQPDFRRGATG